MSSGFSENKGLGGRGAQSCRLIKPGLGHSYLRISHYFIGKRRNINFQEKIVEGANHSLNWLLVQAVLDVVICYVLEILGVFLGYFRIP